MCFSCHCLGKEGFTGSGRAHQQSAFGKGGADVSVLLRIVKEVYNLL